MPTKTTVRYCTILAASLLASPFASAQLVGPSAPTGLAAQATAPGELTLRWEPATSATGVTAYRVYHVEADGSLVHVVDVPADQRALAEAGIAAGTTVTYVVSALDLLGEGPLSEPASATTWTSPSAPRDVAVASGPGLVGEATVSWTAPEADGGTPVLAYLVYRDGALVAQLDAATFAWSDEGLAPLTPYVYAVAALNVVGEGEASAPACGMASPWPSGGGCMSRVPPSQH